MSNTISEVGRIVEGGRGVPIALSRPAGALPYSPIVKQAYAPHPLARIGWGQGIITVADVTLEPSCCALSSADSLATAARLMLDDEAGFVPVCDGGRLVGVVYIDAVLQLVADGRTSPTLADVLSTQIPTCALKSALVDAVRQMIACYLRKIPVVGDEGQLLGLLTMSEACAASARDPAVAEVIDRFASSPSLFARLMR